MICLNATSECQLTREHNNDQPNRSSFRRLHVFNPVRSRIGEILSSSQLKIPIYQRAYAWGKEEALDLIEDLKTYQQLNSQHLFLGNFILEEPTPDSTYVVDGQQRLTTILILLIACRERAKELKLHSLAATIQDKITFVDPTTGEAAGCRLIASDSIRDVFEMMSSTDWDGKFRAVIGNRQVKRQINRVKPIYDYFVSQLQELNKDGMREFLGAVYNAVVIRIIVENEEDALFIFERTNARGVELEIADLLKNYMFSQKIDGIEDLWKQLVDNSGGTILRMLKYFYVSRRGHILKPELYRQLKKYSDKVSPESFTNELVVFSEFYGAAKSADEAAIRTYLEGIDCRCLYGHQSRFAQLTFSFKALKQFRVLQFLPPAYSALNALMRMGQQEKDAKAYVRLIDAFEKYHFINNAICNRIGNEVERIYADYSEAFASSDGELAKVVDQFIKELKGQLAKEDEFVAKFSDLSYSSDQAPLIVYIYDRLTNSRLDPSSWVKLFNPDAKLTRRNVNIEHFMPQNPDPKAGVPPSTVEVVDNIGNLLVISYKTNSRLGNALPSDKLKRLTGDLQPEIQNLNYLSDFIKEHGPDAEDWDKNKILKRARTMGEYGYKNIWNIK